MEIFVTTTFIIIIINSCIIIIIVIMFVTRFNLQNLSTINPSG